MESKADNDIDDRRGLSDIPLAIFQTELIDLAFETASKIPVDPHIKDRSRAQEAVVSTCIQLDQPQRAAGFINRIDNWRRGSCYADLAIYCVKKDLLEEAQHFLDLANEISDTAEDWRKDRIKVKIAQAHTLLGDHESAGQFDSNVAPSEQGKVALTKATVSNENSFDEQMRSLEALVDSENFDLQKNVLIAYAELFSRFYEDPSRRSQVEGEIRTSWERIPILIRIELLNRLAEGALDHSDLSKALALVNEAQVLVDDHQWPIERRIPLIAKLVGLRYRADDTARARSAADAAITRFDEERDTIVNIWRAGALRPLAEAYQAMGGHQAALAVYKKTIEEGVENPNSRPRAEDLSATCASMAVAGVEPDAALWARIREIHKALENPW